MSAGPSTQAVAAGLLASFVGFASSFAVVLKGLTTVGASPAEAMATLDKDSLAEAMARVKALRDQVPFALCPAPRVMMLAWPF